MFDSQDMALRSNDTLLKVFAYLSQGIDRILYVPLRYRLVTNTTSISSCSLGS